MKCAICGRSLFRTAVMIGSEAIGPTCARKLFAKGYKKNRKIKKMMAGEKRVDEKDNLTIDMFSGDFYVKT